MNWRDKAACRGMETDLFFPVGTTGCAVDQTGKAKAVCAACPVRTHCLTYAIETGQEGIWGGLAEDERRALRRKRGR
jgi:WhiB family transcriptional regulator, redox-sensing transcriptional regulator